ncbi:flagellar motor protein MotB [Cystobacter ferrugineus]|uniref:Flagellar motor protein MotB n=1 Tax=Cystobacter ferrugineus TaxID=83449 RepID=A0A1L9B144_9BACT|nr:flagellar motor protein MotB [Cystobacter ferrugineus]OJH35987.1 flagellar motor protein MotB [Cystobacter ferrugineus]
MTLRWVVLLAALLLPGVGEAQAPSTLPSFALQRLHLEPSGLGSLVVGTGRTLAPGVVRVSLQAHYEHLPLNFLRTWDPGVNSIGLVENKSSGHVTAAVGVLPWLQLGAHLPYIIDQRGQRFLDVAPSEGAGLDEPWLEVRAALWRMSEGAPMNVAAELAAALPVGRAELLGRDRYALAPRLQAGFVGEGFQVGGEVGVLLRPRQDLSPLSHREHDVMGSELRLGATVTSRGQNDTATRPEVSVLFNVPLQGGRTSAEVLIGVRKHLGSGVALYFLGGPGLGSAVDMPALRLLAGAAFATGEAD